MRKSFIIFLPIYLFTFIWAFTFLLYFLNPFHLPPLKGYTWFVILSSLGMIYVGFFSGKILSGGLKFEINQEIQYHSKLPIPAKLLKRVVLIFTSLSLLGIVGKNILIIKAIGGIQEFFINPGFTRNFIIQINQGEIKTNIVLLKLFSYLSSFAFPCTFIGGVLYTIPRHKIISFYPVVASFIASTLAFHRSVFIASYGHWLISAYIFTYFLPQIYRNKAIKSLLRQVLYFSIIFVVFSIIILFVRFYYYNPEQAQVLFNSFYFYIAGNLWMLDRYLILDKPPLYGLSLFRSIVSWMSAFGLFDKSSIVPPHYEFYKIYNTAMNTFTFIRIPYEDFKLIGLLIIAYIWGFFTYVGMKIYTERFTFLRLGIAATITFYLFWSFYTFNWTDITALIFRLTLLMFLDLYIQYREKVKQNRPFLSEI